MAPKQSVQPKRSIKHLLDLFKHPHTKKPNKSVRPKRSIDYLLALPVELKLQILCLALPNQTKFMQPHIGRIREDNFHDNRACFEDCFLNLVRALPEMAGLIYEAFYSQNTMSVFESPVTTSNPAYPPRLINMFVRHLHLELDLEVRNLEYLRRLGNGDMGFPDLRSVSIDINGYSSSMIVGTAKGGKTLVLMEDENAFTLAVEDMRHYLETMEPIVFRTKTLEIRYSHAWFVVKHPSMILAQLCDPMETLFLQKTTITESQDSDAMLYRYHGSRYSTELEKKYVDEWPDKEGLLRLGAAHTPDSKRTSVKLLTK